MQPQINAIASLSGYLKSDEVIAERDRLIEHQREIIDGLRLDVKEKSRDISLLKTTIKGFEAALELANSKAIAPNLDAFKSAVDEAVNPKLLEKIDERDREIEVLRDDIKGLIESSRLSNNVISERNTQIEELQITLKNHQEQFDNLKSHFEVTLKAIAMNLNALKGARKPDETKEVYGVMVTFRNYDDNTIIIENVQRAIAEEAKKLKGVNLKDFSFDDIPF
jgi:predicted RNase H-like nuclease (RuvC/YqgF family)